LVQHTWGICLVMVVKKFNGMDVVSVDNSFYGLVPHRCEGLYGFLFFSLFFLLYLCNTWSLIYSSKKHMVLDFSKYRILFSINLVLLVFRPIIEDHAYFHEHGLSDTIF
jgi:hypothetical protein